MSSDPAQRIWQHKGKLAEAFTKRNEVHTLVWYEIHETMETIIIRVPAVKGVEKGLEDRADRGRKPALERLVRGFAHLDFSLLRDDDGEWLLRSETGNGLLLG